MKFGLEQHIIDKLIAVFELHSKVDKAFVFGSRAKGNYRPDSDIDITIKGQELNTDDIIAMSVEFEDKGIAHKIDLINYHTIKESDLKDHIDRVGIELYSRLKEMKLKDIGCTFLSGYAFKSSDYGNIGIPLIKIGNIQNRNVTIDNSGDFVLEKIINQKVAKHLLSNNDVLIAMTGQGSVGRVGKLKIKEGEKALLNQRVGKFICDEKNINIGYLYYVLTSDKYQDLLFNTGSGSGQPNLSPELILTTEIPWVSYKEQTAIASILTSLEDKIDLLHRQNKTLEQLAETLFRQWFVEEAEESWEVETLGYVASFHNGKSRPNEIGKIPIYGGNGILGYTNVFNYSGKSIIVGRVGAYCGSLYFENNEIWVSDNALLVKAKNENQIHYLFYLLKSLELNSMAQGSSHPLLTQTLLKSIEIIKHPKSKIESFDFQVEQWNNKIEFNDKQIRTLTQTRNTLLPKLMSGEARVKCNN